MDIYCTQTFLDSIDRLLKKPKNRCGKVKADICTMINSSCKSVQDFVHISATIQQMMDNERRILLKTRVPNSDMGIGKRGGFRIIAIADLDQNCVTLLEVYPKTGKLGKEDLNIFEYREIIRAFILAVKNGSLIKLDLNNQLSPIN